MYDSKQLITCSVRWDFPRQAALTFFVFLMTICSVWGSGINSYTLVISGTVTDAVTTRPIEGVTISEKGTNNAVVTNKNGQYAITVQNSNAVLDFTYVGYQTQSVTVGDRATIDIKLSAEIKGMDEVVVVGFGTQKKANLTGAVSNVGKEALENRPVANIGQALQGLVPNLNITFGSGAPNITPTFNLRGGTSFTTNSSGQFEVTNGNPLIMIDGVEATAVQLNQLNPNDVLDISFIKDASASAIYGTKGSFGVILVRTKRGEFNQKGKISYAFDASFDTPAAIPDILDAYTIQKAAMERTLWTGGTTSRLDTIRLNNIRKYMDNPIPENAWYRESEAGPMIFVANNNPYDIVRTWTPTQKHTLNFSGGSSNINYYVSLGHQNQEGMYSIETDKFKRYNALFNLNAKVTNWFNLFTKFSYDQSDYSVPYLTAGKTGGSNGIWGVLMGEPGKNVNMPIKMGPNDPLPNAYTDNLLAWMSYGARNKSKDKRMSVLVSPEFILLPKKLKLKADLAYLPQWYSLNRYSPKFNQTVSGDTYSTNQADVAENKAYFDNNTYTMYTGNVYFNYDQTFGKYHNISAVAGYAVEKTEFNQVTTTLRKLISADIQNPTAAEDPTLHTTETGSYISTGQSVFGRFNYNFRERYLLEMNIRYDGSSKFTPRERYVAFPSFSAGWKISDEAFMSFSRSWLNLLKFRGSWGKLGNQPSNPYPFQAVLSTGRSGYLINGSPVIYINPPALVSPQLTFEKAETFNLGVTGAVLSNRLNFDFDWYKRTTRDILTTGAANYPAVLGNNPPLVNAGIIQSKGFEIALSWKDRISDDLRYSVGLNLSDYLVKVLSFPGNSNKLLFASNTWQLYDGKTINEIWGYETGGVLQESDFAGRNGVNYIYKGPFVTGNLFPGFMWYQDINGDGRITNGTNTVGNSGDTRIIGNSTPRYRLGFTGNVQYKGFDFDFLFQGVLKRDLWLGDAAYWGGGAGSKWMYERSWRPDKTDAEFPMYGGGAPSVQTRYLINGAYLRLKQAVLGYTIPQNIIKRVGIDRMRLMLAGFNIFEITKIPAVFDVDQVTAEYPQKRTISVGAQITF